MPYDINAILGFSLFAISEILGVIPLPANGLLHSIVIGFKNSFSNPTNNTSLINNITSTVSKPDLELIINSLATNPNMLNSIKLLVNNQRVLPLMDLVCSNQDIDYLLSLIKNNPLLLKGILNQITPTIQSQQSLIQFSPTPSDQIIVQNTTQDSTCINMPSN